MLQGSHSRLNAPVFEGRPDGHSPRRVLAARSNRSCRLAYGLHVDMANAGGAFRNLTNADGSFAITRLQIGANPRPPAAPVLVRSNVTVTKLWSQAGSPEMQRPCQSLSGTDLSGPRCGIETVTTASSPTPAHYGTRNCASVLLSKVGHAPPLPRPRPLVEYSCRLATRADMTTRALSGYRSAITSQ